MKLLEHLTIRERIIEILRSIDRPLSAEEIAQSLNIEIDVKDVYEHIRHAARSLYAKSRGREVLVMEPPYCRKCGYVFKDMEKPKKPSKCPRCKSQWIYPPRFTIVTCD